MVECNFTALITSTFANVKETRIHVRKTVYLQVIQLPKNIGERLSKSLDRVDISIYEIMEKCNLSELTSDEAVGIIGGGKWVWYEAAICFALAGAVGVGFYTLGTMQ